MPTVRFATDKDKRFDWLSNSIVSVGSKIKAYVKIKVRLKK